VRVPCGALSVHEACGAGKPMRGSAAKLRGGRRRSTCGATGRAGRPPCLPSPPPPSTTIPAPPPAPQQPPPPTEPRRAGPGGRARRRPAARKASLLLLRAAAAATSAFLWIGGPLRVRTAWFGAAAASAAAATPAAAARALQIGRAGRRARAAVAAAATVPLPGSRRRDPGGLGRGLLRAAAECLPAAGAAAVTALGASCPPAPAPHWSIGRSCPPPPGVMATSWQLGAAAEEAERGQGAPARTVGGSAGPEANLRRRLRRRHRRLQQQLMLQQGGRRLLPTPAGGPLAPPGLQRPAATAGVAMTTAGGRRRATERLSGRSAAS
jgi:hypothetical protein